MEVAAMGAKGILSSLGVGRELQVAVFGGKSSEQALESHINEWLGEHPETDIVEVQYKYAINANVGWYSALILYRAYRG
jgi:hypothetical protein